MKEETQNEKKKMSRDLRSIRGKRDFHIFSENSKPRTNGLLQKCIGRKKETKRGNSSEGLHRRNDLVLL